MKLLLDRLHSLEFENSGVICYCATNSKMFALTLAWSENVCRASKTMRNLVRAVGTP